ncbi:MAG: DNA polymerase III subunit gamma/tau C-terminal domain-containing protein, partial [Steroidobacterales bacterium]
ASRTRVDDTRELLDNVQYAPTRSRYKIYLIDEVHMLSAHSFNALLKTLEEPPPHVKFLLATTDPQKLPVTVLSRCLQFNLKRLSVALISARLRQILEAEKIAYEPAALQLLAIAGDGSLRDALSLLDQLLAYGNGRAGEADARSMLGTVEREHSARLVRLLAQGSPAPLLDYAQSLEEFSPDYAQLLDQLAALLERIAIKQLVAGYEGDELHGAELLSALAAMLAPEDVQLYYQTAILGRRDLTLAPDARTGFRMTLIRMLAFRPQGASATATASSGGGTASAGGASVAAAMPAVAASTVLAASAAAATRAPPSGAAAAPAVAAAAVNGNEAAWPAVLAALELQGVTHQLGANCVLLARSPGMVRLALDPRNAALRTPVQEDKLAQALARYYGEPLRLEIEVRESPEETPARARERATSEQLAQARAHFDADPTVEALKRRFGASVLIETVQPSKPPSKRT